MCEVIRLVAESVVYHGKLCDDVDLNAITISLKRYL